MKGLETLIYVGVNRRADKTGIERVLALEPDECAAILSHQQELSGQCRVTGPLS